MSLRKLLKAIRKFTTINHIYIKILLKIEYSTMHTSMYSTFKLKSFHKAQPTITKFNVQRSPPSIVSKPLKCLTQSSKTPVIKFIDQTKKIKTFFLHRLVGVQFCRRATKTATNQVNS